MYMITVMNFCGPMFLTECQTLEFEVHGRDSFGNKCSLEPKSVSLQSVPEGALSADTRVTPGSSPSVVIVTATVLRPGEHPGTWLDSYTGALTLHWRLDSYTGALKSTFLI